MIHPEEGCKDSSHWKGSLIAGGGGQDLANDLDVASGRLACSPFFLKCSKPHG